MRVLKLHHPTGHPYWNAGEYRIELPNGEFLNASGFLKYPTAQGYGLEIKEDGIYLKTYWCSSGRGRKPATDIPSRLIVSCSLFDNIEYIGQELNMSPCLIDDLKENKML